EELLLRSGPHGAHAGEDAAPGAGDVRVGAAPQALGVLRRAAAGKHQVRMAVNEPGGHPGAAQVVCLLRPACLGQIALRAHPLDARATGEEPGGREATQRRIAGGNPGIPPEVQRLGRSHGENSTVRRARGFTTDAIWVQCAPPRASAAGSRWTAQTTGVSAATAREPESPPRG